jgi:hypothetical protein
VPGEKGRGDYAFPVATGEELAAHLGEEWWFGLEGEGDGLRGMGFASCAGRKSRQDNIGVVICGRRWGSHVTCGPRCRRTPFLSLSDFLWAVSQK